MRWNTFRATAARSRNKWNTWYRKSQPQWLDMRTHKGADKLPDLNRRSSIPPANDHFRRGISARGALIDKWLRQWRRGIQWVVTSWTPKDMHVCVLYRREICDRDTTEPTAINMKRKPLHTARLSATPHRRIDRSVDLSADPISKTRARGEKGSHGYRDRSIDRGRVLTQQDNKSSMTPMGDVTLTVLRNWIG